MVDFTDLTGSRMYASRDGHIVFDTNHKSVNLFPDAYNITRTVAGGNPITIEFPELLKANAYFRFGEGFYSGGRTACRSYTTLLYQEWGPDFPNADDWWFPGNPGEPGQPNLTSNFRNLPQTYIGSVPAGTDYIDVRVRLSNTVVPSPIMEVPIFPILQTDQWTNLPGGSCPIELRSPLSRLFEFKRVGNDVYLRRYQSVYRGQQIPWIPGNNDDRTSGWTYGASAANTAAYLPSTISSGGSMKIDLGRLAYQLEYKPDDTNGNKRRFGTNACSLVDTSNYRSVWSGDLIIRPGRRT